ncbi:MAG: hypothetical protein ACK5NG_06165 [Chthoniobacterales bacterium]
MNSGPDSADSDRKVSHPIASGHSRSIRNIKSTPCKRSGDRKAVNQIDRDK